MDILAPRLRHERRFPDEAAYAAWLFNACCVDYCCFAWNKLIDMLWKITYIGTTD
jgi:hypothetical protein